MSAGLSEVVCGAGPTGGSPGWPVFTESSPVVAVAVGGDAGFACSCGLQPARAASATIGRQKIEETFIYFFREYVLSFSVRCSTLSPWWVSTYRRTSPTFGAYQDLVSLVALVFGVLIVN